MNSPIALLTDVLQTVLSASQSYRAQLQGNEAATRAALIDPVLRVLGWDIANPARVLVEKTQTVKGQNLKVDYALLADGDVKLVVEAKKLDGSLEEHFLQLVNYSFGFESLNIFITDGVRWQHFSDLNSKNQLPKWDVNLQTANLSEVASYLIEHLDAALVAPETPPIDELADKVENLEQKVAFLEKLISKPPIKPPNGAKWKFLEKNEIYTKTRPTGVRLPNGQEKKVSQWKPVLVEVCRFVLENAPQLRNQMPLADNAGRSVNLISLQQPPSNLSSAAIELEGQTFYVHCTYSANAVVANVLHVLKQLPDSREKRVAVRFD